jgi:ABC-type uncharacterized transport system auxiliary subunit
MRSINPPCRAAIAVALLLGAMLAGCSDMYWDRRESISLATGDAVATNKVVHMIDPWPPMSTQKNLVFDGTRAQAAAERYRNNRVIRPVNVTTSSANYQQIQQQANPAPNN